MGYKHKIWLKLSLCDTFFIVNHDPPKFLKWLSFSRWPPSNKQIVYLFPEWMDIQTF